MPRSLLPLLLSLTLLSACVSIPQSPIEHREAAKSGRTFFTAESFDVNRPFAEVAKAFKQMAPECLSFTLTHTEKPVIGFGSSTRQVATAKPTVLVSRNKAELHFQTQFKNVVVKEPKGGTYYLIADAYPIGNGKTRVDIYRAQVQLVADAVKGWATGENLGCPDATRIF